MQEIAVLLFCDESKARGPADLQFLVGCRESICCRFPAWSLNPFAALALCWFTEEYEVAYGITQSLASEELTLAMLLQADKLVQMLESPVFVHVRLQLLNAGSPSLVPLLQSLYGLLMILPQSNSYRLLQNRLSGIMPMHIILQNCGEKP